MKNLLTYINVKKKKFTGEYEMTVKIQIDNSLRLGWKKEDIVLVTNFDYEYKGVKSIVIGDDSYCSFFWPSTKIYSIVTLFKFGLIEDDLYWYHDFDCFQLSHMKEPPLGDADMGLTNYGRMPRLCSASMFFKKSAKDIFERIKTEVDKTGKGEEEAIMNIVNNDSVLQKRVKLLNITYAFHKFNLWHCWCRADKPIKAVHFHLTPDKYDFYVRGNNPMKKVLIPRGLIRIFRKHGFNK